MKYLFKNVISLIAVVMTVFSIQAFAAHHVAMPAVWGYSGGETAPMTVTFNKDGTLMFKGGFENLNPGAWKLNPATNTLTITLKKYHYQKDVIAAMLANKEITQYSRRTRTFYYRFDETTKTFCLLGWCFFPK